MGQKRSRSAFMAQPGNAQGDDDQILGMPAKDNSQGVTYRKIIVAGLSS
jgi:hypothetical protein